jgi:hypothetical protein
LLVFVMIESLIVTVAPLPVDAEVMTPYEPFALSVQLSRPSVRPADVWAT